jgi:nucleoside-diphosphate-sugar epimerase
MSPNSPKSSGAAGGSLIQPEEGVLVTGANGFVGSRVVKWFVDHGFRNVRAFVRSAERRKLESLLTPGQWDGIQFYKGNLLSREDCLAATEGVSAVLHLAAGRGEKFVPDAFMNSVITTRNLLDACVQHNRLKRFVNVSSFAVYRNDNQQRPGLLDETCPMEASPAERGEAYTFGKVKQDEVVLSYAREHGIPIVIMRPGVVYGPGNLAITGRVGIDTFGVFLHMGGSNPIPFTYVDNCAEAIALAGVTRGIDGEAFNIVDDNLPSSREFLRLYKKNVRRFRSVAVPQAVSYGLCYLWERYSDWSAGQLPPAFNRSRWRSQWKRTRYTNDKLKSRVGWVPQIPTEEGMRRYFEACRERDVHA